MRRVVRTYWMRSVAPWLLVAGVFVFAPFVVALTRGDRSWVVGMFGALSAVIALLGVTLYRAHRDASMARLNRLVDGRASMELHEDDVHFHSDAGISRIEWRRVREVWQHREFWLLLLAPNEFVTLPAANLDRETRSIIVERLTATGARFRTIGASRA